MKKLLTISLIMMFGFLPHRAHAQNIPPCFPYGCGLTFGGTTATTAAWWGGFAAFALLPVAIIELQDVKPWSKIFPVVEERYPHDPKYWGMTTVPVAMVTPESRDFVYEDENGIHYPKQAKNGI